MKLDKIGRLIRNPDIFSILLKTRSVKNARLYLRKKEARKKMIDASHIVDLLLSKNESISNIIEIASSQTRMTRYPIAWYCLVRKYKPSIIVETGTSMG